MAEPTQSMRALGRRLLIELRRAPVKISEFAVRQQVVDQTVVRAIDWLASVGCVISTEIVEMGYSTEWEECPEHLGQWQAYRRSVVVEPGEDPVDAFTGADCHLVTDCQRCIEAAEREDRALLG